MQRKIITILFLISSFALFFGFTQLASQNEVFNDTMLRCCNIGMCHDEPCSQSCSVSTIASGCQDYTTNCEGCMDLINQSTEKGFAPFCSVGYGGPESTWCWNGSNKYYATFKGGK